jgi:AcrR family transcriptional regulator
MEQVAGSGSFGRVDREPEAAVTSTADKPAAAPARSGRRQKLHRGRTIEERRAQRRAALRDAALELFGTKGYANTSIGELCRTSYVTARYFYEEYGDRESLLLDLYETLIAEIGEKAVSITAPPGPDHAREATRARLSMFVHSVTADDQVARVLLLESGSAKLEARRRVWHGFFAGFVAERAFPYVESGEILEGNFELMALCFVGAVNEACTHWILTPPEERIDVDDIIDTLAEMYMLVRAGFERPRSGS